MDPELRPLLGNRIYGCDDCLAVCPWNKFAARAREAGYAAREGAEAPRLADLAALDDAGFRQAFSGSAIKRIGRNRFVRNVAYAIGNSGDAGLAPVARRLAADADPVVARRGSLGGGAAQLSRCRLARASAREVAVGVGGDQLEPDLGGAVAFAGLGQRGAGFEERFGEVGRERQGALGLGEGGGRVALVAQRRGEQGMRQRVVRAVGEGRVERRTGGGPVGLRRGDAGEEELAVGVGGRDPAGLGEGGGGRGRAGRRRATGRRRRSG